MGVYVTGLLTTATASRANGALAGARSLGTEISAVAMVAGFGFLGSCLLLGAIDFITSLGVGVGEEEMGLDESQHCKGAYN